MRCAWTATARRKSTKLYLCGWPEAHPEFFINAPGWPTRLVGGGAMIHPEEHCVRCPGFHKLAGKPIADTSSARRRALGVRGRRAQSWPSIV